MLLNFPSITYALKSVWRRKAKNFYAILGIALGISLLLGVQVSVDSVKAGWIDASVYSISERHIQVFGTISPSINQSLYESLLESTIRDSNEHIQAVTARLSWSGAVSNVETGNIDVGVTFTGIRPEEKGFGDYYDDSDLTKVLLLNDLEKDEVYIGRELANSLSLQKGDNLEISIGEGNENLRIRAIYGEKSRGIEDYSTHIVMGLSDLQNYLDYGSQVNVLYISLDDEIKTEAESDKVIEDIKTALNSVSFPPGTLPPGFRVSDLFVIVDVRQTTRTAIVDVMDSLTMVMNIFGSLVIFAGLLLIVNIQFMSVEDREIQTGIGRAIGVRKKQVIWSVLTESFILGIISALVAIPMGAMYGLFLTYVFAATFGIPFEILTLVVTTDVMINSLIIGIGIALLTALIPAIRASNINVVEVIRGIIPPPEEKLGRKGFYTGIVLLIIGVLWFLIIGIIPTGPDSFRHVNDAEALYFPFILIFVSIPLILSYLVTNRQLVMNLMAISLIALPIFNIFFVFDWIKEGSGGTFWIIGIAMSLIVGNIFLIGLNLDYIADAAEFVTSYFTSLAALAQIAFRNMASNKTRSTLTFAIFASILTINIFMATWSYSTRYGFNEQMFELSGGIDVGIFSQNYVPNNISSNGKNLVTQIRELDSGIQYVSNVTIPRDPATVFRQPEFIFTSSDTVFSSTCFVLNKDTLWSDDETQEFVLPLSGNKTGSLDVYNVDETTEDNYEIENSMAWEALFNGTTIVNKDGIKTPFLISNNWYITDPTGMTSKVPTGESVWFPAKNGSLIEFVIGAFYFGNPIVELHRRLTATIGSGGFAYGPNFFIPEEYALQLSFYSEEMSNVSNLFLVKTSGQLDDSMNEEIANKIEIFANAPDSDFRIDHGIFGFVAVPLWDIYEFLLESNYNFFNFMQVFTSLGFVVGIVGLLVVSVRSVSERKREIGMMRAIGFTGPNLILTILTELVVMGLIGLVVGLINGCLLGWALTDINSGGSATFLIPFDIIALYSIITLGAAFIAAILPGVKASKIPPSEALRYVG